MSQLYKHCCVTSTAALKRGIIIPSSQRRERQSHQRQSLLLTFPRRASSTPWSDYRDPLRFHRIQEVPHHVGKAVHYPELRRDASTRHQGLDSTTLEDSVFQIHSESPKETRASNVHNSQLCLFMKVYIPADPCLPGLRRPHRLRSREAYLRHRLPPLSRAPLFFSVYTLQNLCLTIRPPKTV